MPKTKISEFSATPANNTDIDSINIAEGCAPSGINDAIRELMAQLKDFQTGAAGDSFNGPIGTSTAAAGAFTTLSASSTATLSGLTASTALALDASKNVVSVTNTGTGNNVLATSPTLVTPILGTPTSATLTNATGLPISTGVSGLGTGVATFLATPSSANLAAALTDETGSGANVFATSPTLVTPVLGTPTSATLTNATGLPLTTGVTGTLPTANGGTNLTSFTSGGVVYASSSSALATGSGLTFDGTNSRLFLNTTSSVGAEQAIIAFNSAGTYSQALNTRDTNASASGNAHIVLRKSDNTYIGSFGRQSTDTAMFVDGNEYLALRVNQTEGMRLTSTGLGIGTSSLFTTAANRGNISLNGTTDAIFAIGTGGTRRGYIYADSAHIEVVADGYMALAAGGAERARITSAGNVGIGTSSPTDTFSFTKALDVNGSSGAFVYVRNNGSATNVGGIGYSGTDLYITNKAAGNIRFFCNTDATERARIDSSGNVGIGTSSPAARLHVVTTAPTINTLESSAANGGYLTFSNGSSVPLYIGFGSTLVTGLSTSDAAFRYSDNLVFGAGATERARITSGGTLFIGRTSDTDAAGLQLEGSGFIRANRDGGTVMVANRNTDDGALVSFRQAGTEEGNISVSGTTVSYNGGHLSRWAQTTTAKDESLVKGTVLSNLDEMNVYTKDGQPVDNEQLNKVKVSDTEGDVNVAGVFVNWSHDDDHNVDEINMAMTGDMIIRIAQGVTVVRGDLLMSAGDGTAKPQGDDIVRSKTVAKVTSNHVTCTYADGSYCVPCVLMAC